MHKCCRGGTSGQSSFCLLPWFFYYWITKSKAVCLIISIYCQQKLLCTEYLLFSRSKDFSASKLGEICPLKIRHLLQGSFLASHPFLPFWTRRFSSQSKCLHPQVSYPARVYSTQFPFSYVLFPAGFSTANFHNLGFFLQMQSLESIDCVRALVLWDLWGRKHLFILFLLYQPQESVNPWQIVPLPQHWK